MYISKLIFTGPKWFKKFGQLTPEDTMIYPTDEEVIEFQNKVDNIRQWAQQSKRHILQLTGGDKLGYLNQAIFLERRKFDFDSKALDVVVSI